MPRIVRLAWQLSLRKRSVLSISLPGDGALQAVFFRCVSVNRLFFLRLIILFLFSFLAQGHGGESPDSMPIAWHNPITNKTSYVHALMFEFLSGCSNGSRRCYGGSGLLSQWFESILL